MGWGFGERGIDDDEERYGYDGVDCEVLVGVMGCDV